MHVKVGVAMCEVETEMLDGFPVDFANLSVDPGEIIRLEELTD